MWESSPATQPTRAARHHQGCCRRLGCCQHRRRPGRWGTCCQAAHALMEGVCRQRKLQDNCSAAAQQKEPQPASLSGLRSSALGLLAVLSVFHKRLDHPFLTTTAAQALNNPRVVGVLSPDDHPQCLRCPHLPDQPLRQGVPQSQLLQAGSR